MKNLSPKKNICSIALHHIPRFTTQLFVSLAVLTFVSGCEHFDGLEDMLDDKKKDMKPTMFTVHVENVSTPKTLDTERANGTVPLSPGAYAVYSGENPLFTSGEMADKETARIAEDGFPMKKAEQLKNSPDVMTSGMFESPGGADNGPAIFAGESAMFTITAKPGDRLQIQTMFVQSNDWFYAFGDEGLSLFHNKEPISGNVTSELVLYDAGTELDTPPGTGPFQKPVQDPMATNVGPGDPVKSIQPANERHPKFHIPPVGTVIKVTVTPQYHQ